MRFAVNSSGIGRAGRSKQANELVEQAVRSISIFAIAKCQLRKRSKQKVRSNRGQGSHYCAVDPRLGTDSGQLCNTKALAGLRSLVQKEVGQDIQAAIDTENPGHVRA